METPTVLPRRMPAGAEPARTLLLRYAQGLAVAALLLSFPPTAFAQVPFTSAAADAANSTPPGPAGAEADDDNFVDQSYESVDNMVQSAITAVDSFFGNSERDTFEAKKSRVRLRLNSDYIQHHGWDFSPKVKFHLLLPGLSSRLRLVMNEDQAGDADQASSTTDDENDVALRWIGRQNDKRGYSFDLGLRLKSGNLDPFGRVNWGMEYAMSGQWVGQTTNRLYYYSRTGVRNDFRQFFNRAITDTLLFRARTRLQYFEENDYNPYIEQKFSLFQSLRPGRKVAYEALFERMSPEDSPFDESEILVTDAAHYDHYRIQARFRQQVARPWFFVEFWPIVSWPEERDYQTTLAGRIRLEISLGGSGDPRLDE